VALLQSEMSGPLVGGETIDCEWMVVIDRERVLGIEQLRFSVTRLVVTLLCFAYRTACSNTLFVTAQLVMYCCQNTRFLEMPDREVNIIVVTDG